MDKEESKDSKDRETTEQDRLEIIKTVWRYKQKMTSYWLE